MEAHNVQLISMNFVWAWLLH